MTSATTLGRKVRVITGDSVTIISGESLTAVQSSITCNGGLPDPCSASGCKPPPEPKKPTED